MKTIFSALLFVSATIAYAQIPENYYDNALDLTSYELKSALHEIINGHSSQSYSALWSHFENTDKKADGKVWDIYSDVPGGAPPYTFTFFDDQCGNYSGESDCYNREHSFPKSWFNDDDPMYTDLFHLYPTDGYVNGRRANNPFGEVNSPTYTSLNGSKSGPCSYPGYTGIVFEPIDEYKGDLARSYFYMATRYEDIISGWENYSEQGDIVLDGSSDKVYETWFLNLLFDWHHQDTVSEKEINRNNEIYSIQGNRNPFIDHPEYADCIWLNQCDEEDPDTVIIPTCNGFANFPVSSDNPLWIEEWIIDGITQENDTTYIFYTLIGDTIIQEQYYSKIYELPDTIPTIETGQYWGAIRKDTCEKVWFNQDNTDYLLFDFSVEVKDTIFYQPIGQSGEQFLVVENIYSVLLNDGELHKRYSFKNSSRIWIEGVGDTQSLLWSTAPNPDCKKYFDSDSEVDCSSITTNLNCLYKGDELAYKNCPVSCYSISDPSDESNDTIPYESDTCIKCLDFFPTTLNNPVWIEEWIFQDLLGAFDTTYVFYTLVGDTLLNDTIYSKLYQSTDFWPTDTNSVFVGAIRNDTCGHVWLKQNNMKYLLYDFSAPVNDTILYQYSGTVDSDYLVVKSLDSVLLKDMKYHAIMNFKNSGNVWIEGVGDIFTLLWNNIATPDCGASFKTTNNINCGNLKTKLNCFYSDSQLVFKNCLGKCFENEDTGTTLLEKNYQSSEKRLITIYPQPVTNTIHIKFLNAKTCNIKIINNTGQIVREFSRKQSDISINVSDIKPGVYVILASNQDNSISQVEKIIILR